MIRFIRCTVLSAALLCAMAAPAIAQTSANEGTAVLEAAAEARARGSRDAPVVVFEIADFQCPYCARFAEEVFPSIDSAYVQTGQVQWVFVNLPLPAHREAWGAAEAALCAGAADGSFWEVHDLLYARQREWSGAPDAAPRFLAYAAEAGIAGPEYARCIAEDRVAPLIIQDLLGAAAADISGTPTFIVNRQSRVVGLRTFEEWREILDAALGAAQP
ncbi:MAG TPA: thioredoxin domain-containing protein [Longimicrobiales bacterium]